MITGSGLKIGSEGRELKQWVWVLFCTLVIFSAIPLARRVQQFVYATAGRDFFTYFVVSVVVFGSAAFLYYFAFRLKIKRISQYIWLLACSALYIFFAMQLQRNPEEAVHLLEYGLLSYFLFRALGRRIRDRSVYITVVLAVLFIGIIDECMQWMTSGRYWGWNDVVINMLGGAIFQLAIWKGIRPEIMSGPLRRSSVKFLAGGLTINLLLLGLCLSNTPAAVNRYTVAINGLSWLRAEEPMAEFGHRHEDREIGVFDSRLTLQELRSIDLEKGESYGRLLSEEARTGKTLEQIMQIYNQYTDPFLFEFLVHVLRRDESYKDLSKTDEGFGTVVAYDKAYGENLILEKYFGNTLLHSGLKWSDDKAAEIAGNVPEWRENYKSSVGSIITAFSLRTAWLGIALLLILSWTVCLKLINRQTA